MNTTLRSVVALMIAVLPGLGAGTALAQPADPSATGLHPVTAAEYTQGNQAFTPTGFPAPVEFTAVVFYPTDLQNGPYPLVAYLHGRHATCGSSTLAWPCPWFLAPIKSYRGYDYSAQQLAGHGYIVISISANGINARDNNVGDLGARARAELIDRHLEFWRTLNTTGAAPFGTRFVGRVDLTRVGTMGHSRGGEGALRHFIFNAAKPSPFPVKAIVPIAPTNFSRWQVNNGVAVAQILSYCDGDVNNIQGIHVYDDGRYLIPTSGSQSYVAVMGGNHNYYNTVWTPGMGPGASDDWSLGGDPHCGTVSGNRRLTAAQQRAVGLAYLSTFFRTEVGREVGFFGYEDGSAGRPPSVQFLDLHATYHGNDTQRRDLNRLLSAGDLSTNFLGGASGQQGLSPHDLCGGDFPQPQHCLAGQPPERQPHTASSAFSSRSGLSQLRTGWSGSGATYFNDIPFGPDRDLSGFSFLDFRSTVNFADGRNAAGQAQDFSVVFEDETGATQSLRAGQFSRALFFPPGTTGPVPKVWHNTVQMPLSSLTAVDRTRISRVTFRFDQRPSGALLFSDLHFYRQPMDRFFYQCQIDVANGTNGCGDNTVTVTSAAGNQYVARVNLARGFKRLDVIADVCNPSGWLIHLTDSPSGDGGGGDFNDTQHDAEAYIKDGTTFEMYGTYDEDRAALEPAVRRRNAFAASGCSQIHWTAQEDRVTFDDDGDPGDAPAIVVETPRGFDLAPYGTASDPEPDIEDADNSDANLWYVAANRTVGRADRSGAGVSRLCFVLSASTNPDPATIRGLCGGQ